ncbi:MAG: Asp-tRNA(Asn) amidotransferase subunit GatC [Methanobrevibacter boviskoreani]|jgi:aspartyl-tRNA(Asn)/glutamyl-tRNA(Gln) amidotransferase subunit C|uniref:Asp-tRNA(Asn) amidotransferase subunit GatC n=1 Tax=Methanobrevibacter TaxID=2172 RepID=UPI000334822C|nr:MULTISPECIES: Asp-tRNA(Asn) amidotransferase subunit GatC [Methanobrevibacter]AGN16697.1 Asp-tRNA(Asn)/Glu-tRNA(Gln) amidotransferase subunit C GatC [Methanobrevibacter sp. AbM4]MCI6774855.1 Asp-tRNA(Asn) amidotransferase subunit GatC [Methanobrevibacter boviskoreani]MCI6929819.1 Asp-tRNA(Asn) amidotransferase subunit GatC [Methanobrevibacter boviskoreani]MDD6256639.1 Asp-tRNA(Asn) amidotransferase subunit GatC [Methanobrevibacter boviskoreani]MDY5614277.1 Asp-tRNA(Asn) amidotransferase sub
MEIKEDAEKILNEFSKTLDSIPDLEETYYITDNLNLTRKDEAVKKDPSKILRNAKIDKKGGLVVKKAKWTQ